MRDIELVDSVVKQTLWGSHAYFVLHVLQIEDYKI